MRKLISLLLATVLALCLVSVSAEENAFLVSDWTMVYSFGGAAIAGQTLFIYEDNTFEVMDEDESTKGTWTFDGETLTLTADGQDLSLKWDEAAHQFTGEYSGMDITMTVPIEPEQDQPEDAEAPAGMVAGGWTVADDPAVTEEVNNLFWQAMETWQTGTITVAYTPVALLGTQVVAGTNYAVLCRASEINKGATWVIVYLYRDLEDTATVLEVKDLPLGV